MFASLLLTCYGLILSFTSVLKFAQFSVFSRLEKLFNIRPFEFNRSGIVVFTHRSVLIERVSLQSTPVHTGFKFETVLSTISVFTWILRVRFSVFCFNLRCYILLVPTQNLEILSFRSPYFDLNIILYVLSLW